MDQKPALKLKWWQVVIGSVLFAYVVSAGRLFEVLGADEPVVWALMVAGGGIAYLLNRR